MRYRYTFKWKIIAAFILVLCLAIVGANYLSFVSYKPLRVKAAIALVYDAALATFGSTLRKVDIRRDKPDQDIPEIHLVIEPSSLETMVSDLPDSAKAHYYKARLLYPDGKWRRVQYRLRGRNIWHWQEQKPSLRIKTRKENPVNMHRHLNLINPEDVMMLGNPYGEALSRKFGVLAPNTDMVKLYINKKYKGVYQLTNREDESFLRFNKRFPGPLYVGNYLRKQWIAEDFELEGDLDVLEFSNPMEEVTKLLSKDPTSEQIDALWRLVDKDKMASWAALMTVISGTHSDYHHNQVFYLDPTIGKIEPVVSDILALGVILYPEGKKRLFQEWKPSINIPIHERLTPILATAMADPNFVYLKNKKIYEALTSFASVEEQINLLEEMSARIEKALFSDPSKAALQRTAVSWYRMPYSNWQYSREKKRVHEFIKLRSAFVINELQKSSISYYQTSNSQYETEFTIEASGHSAIQFITEEFSQRYPLKIRNAQGSKINVKTSLLLHPGLYRHFPEKFHPHLAGRRSPEYMLIPGKRAYHFTTSNSGWHYIQENTKKLFKNGITGEGVEILKTPSLRSENVVHTIFSLPRFEDRKTDIVLGPETVTLKDDMLIPETATLRILPGTQILLGEGVSIISRGKVSVEGTEKAPVTLKRFNLDKPWGVFAAVGKGAANSQIKYLEASGGSSEFQQHINFSGMVSLHHLDNLKIQNINLSNNSIGDDTLRIIASNVDANNLNIHSCASDCIDFDFVQGVAKNVKIKNAGNDGFDFMSSKVDIVNYEVEKCGDKGISLGELSIISGKGISISGCDIGIAAKDKSLGTFEDIRVTNSRVGFSSYKKNWRYGGAGKIIAEPYFSGNENDFEEPKILGEQNGVGHYPVSLWQNRY